MDPDRFLRLVLVIVLITGAVLILLVALAILLAVIESR
jgi:hypothetical protein